MKKIGITVAIVASLALGGCGGSSGGSSSSSSSSSATVSGTASKGIVANGIVSAFLFESNGVPSDTALATTETDANGEYTLTLPNSYNGEPLYIEITADADTTMKCDIAGGCGTGFAFGEDYPLNTGTFSLGAVLPEAEDGTVSVNLTPFTTAAASDALDSIADAGSDFGAEVLIDQANSSMANTINDILGLEGEEALNQDELLELETVDLTSADDIEATSDDLAIQVAAISAGIVSAYQEDGSNSIEDAINDFVEDITEAPLVFDDPDDGDTDIADILAEATSVVTTVESEVLDEGNSILDDIASAIEDAEENAAEEGDSAVDDTPSNTAGLEEIAQVKAFVEELRELGTAIDSSIVEDSEGVAQGTVEALVENFDNQVEAADLFSSDDVEISFSALGKALNAIIDVYADEFVDEGVDPTAGVYESPQGVVVTVAVDSGVATLTVVESQFPIDFDGSEVLTDVGVSAVVTAFDIDDGVTEVIGEGIETESGTLSADIDIDFSGSVAYGTVAVELTNGILQGDVVGTIDETYTFEFSPPGVGEVIGTGTETEVIDNVYALGAALIDADVIITQTSFFEGQPDGPMTFTGGIALELEDLDFIEIIDEIETYDGFDWTYSEEEDLTLSLDMLSLSLNGMVENDEDSFELNFSIEGNGTGVTFTDISDFENSLTDGVYTESESGESSGETPSNYVGVTATLGFTAGLAGVADVVEFEFEATRSGYDDLSVEVSLSYPGRSIMVELDVIDIDVEDGSSGTLTLSNNDGVTITLEGEEGASEDEFEGEITIDGETYAVLDNVDGLDIIRYADGEFESAF